GWTRTRALSGKPPAPRSAWPDLLPARSLGQTRPLPRSPVPPARESESACWLQLFLASRSPSRTARRSAPAACPHDGRPRDACWWTRLQHRPEDFPYPKPAAAWLQETDGSRPAAPAWHIGRGLS